MDTISNIPEDKSKRRVVIIGGGFAGLELCKTLNSKYYQIILLDRHTYYQFQPLFYQVATGGLEASSIAYPHRKSFQNKKDFHYRLCSAEKIFPDEKRLETTIGTIHYDYLVVAAGCDTNYFGNDRLKETTYALKSIPEALLLRNRILLSLEEAVNVQDKDKLKEILNFVIVGGGATGVELAGALADMKRTILPKDYPEIDFDNMEIHLINGAPRLLSSMSEASSREAARILTDRGVTIHHGTLVEGYENAIVKMNDGSELVSRNVFWVGGVKPNRIEGLNESSYEKGALSINEYCEAKCHDYIFAIGDAASLTTDKWPKGHPQVAQVAMQMARRLGKNMNYHAKGKYGRVKKFYYRDKGTMATIGRHAAVVDLKSSHFSGILAWWLWLTIHIFFIVGIRNKILVFIDWTWNYLRYDSSLRLLIKPRENSMYKETESSSANQA